MRKCNPQLAACSAASVFLDSEIFQSRARIELVILSEAKDLCNFLAASKSA
jgi:hypothetical protein